MRQSNFPWYFLRIENCLSRSMILTWCSSFRCLLAKSGIFMFGHALLEVTGRVANVLCITLIFVNNTQSIDQWWLYLCTLSLLPIFGLVNRLYVYVDFAVDVFQLSSDGILRLLILERIRSLRMPSEDNSTERLQQQNQRKHTTSLQESMHYIIVLGNNNY